MAKINKNAYDTIRQQDARIRALEKELREAKASLNVRNSQLEDMIMKHSLRGADIELLKKNLKNLRNRNWWQRLFNVD